MTPVNIKDLIQLRLQNQQITITKPDIKNPVDVVKWFGAMQSQDFPMSRWAIGNRLPKCDDHKVLEAYNEGEILRTHLLRPTWHLVAAKDLRWLLKLTSPQIKMVMRSYSKSLGLDEVFIKKAKKIIEKAFSKGDHLTRELLYKHLESAKIELNQYIGSHILMHCEMDGMICSGKMQGEKLSYALMDQRIATDAEYGIDESLAMLAMCYFQSHGPASIRDFAWWSGLGILKATHAVKILGKQLQFFCLAEQNYYFMETYSFEISEPVSSATVKLLPSFDEYVISYEDRSAVIEQMHMASAFSKNGIFYPIILINGRVEGVWKRAIEKSRVKISISPFNPFKKKELAAIQSSALNFAQFINKQLDFKTN